VNTTIDSTISGTALAESGGARPARRDSSNMAFFWMSAFYLVYCIRPEDWLPALAIIPLAKITAIGAFLAFLFGGKRRRGLRDLPAESYYLLGMIVILMLSAVFSPVWRGGAVSHTLDFAKVYVVFVLTFLLLTDLAKFRRILFIQAASVPAICILSLVKGHDRPRLEGVLGGIYNNPNDLAFAIVLSIPFCLMFLLRARGFFRKLLWTGGMLVMVAALFKTASRGGFITLIVAGSVLLWHFGVKGKRLYLVVGSALVVLFFFGLAGTTMRERLSSFWDSDQDTEQGAIARASYDERWFLVRKAVEGMEHYPVLGIGVGNFEVYSTVWHEVHIAYLEIGVEGGVFAMVLYFMFFARGFGNLRQLAKRKDLPSELILFRGALHSSLVGFVVGALFSPEAYQFFPYFAVAYTSALLAYVRESEQAALPVRANRPIVPVNAYMRPSRVPLNS
jgi:O-antigen ligase